MKNNYADLLKQLKNGDIQTIEVTPDEFMAFQKAFMDFESRKRVVGTANREGKIVYHFEQ
ncbi:hypothetical protein [Nicoliella lavandulae]|uniref:Uncharacterized protein n=1 Tax=Nicoliella lavandulae TaxID=3082954 RepID=A0ABU8SI55_9LACO